MGHDVLTFLETGKAGQSVPDHAVLELACAEDRILLTYNRKHFIRLHRQHPVHPGIAVCTVDPDFLSLAHRIHEVIAVPDGLSGQLIRIHRPGS